VADEEKAPVILSRHDRLVEVAEKYGAAAQANYSEVRNLSERLRAGFCAWLGAFDGTCVFLVPPIGPYETRAYGDLAFSMPPKGFKSLDPIAFGLAVRITRQGDWFRLPITCLRDGETMRLEIVDGPHLNIGHAATDVELEGIYATLLDHITGYFERGLDHFERGDYGGSDIGFAIASPGNHTD
jgi:hypothetical protein